MKKIALFLLLIAAALVGGAQKFRAAYLYDANGNRIQATVIYLSQPPFIENPETIEDKVEGDVILKISPNPTHGLIRIEIEGDYEEVVEVHQNYIFVSEIGGRTLLKISPIKVINDIDLSKKPAGVYIIRVETGKFRKTYKIIKQ